MASKRPEWATKTGPVTQAERERIIELADRGWPHYRAARDLGRHPSAVFHHYVVNGFVRPKATATSAQPATYERSGRSVVRFSAEEDAFIEALSCQGYTNSQIARLATKRFGHKRNPPTIKYRLCMLAAAGNSEAA